MVSQVAPSVRPNIAPSSIAAVAVVGAVVTVALFNLKFLGECITHAAYFLGVKSAQYIKLPAPETLVPNSVGERKVALIVHNMDGMQDIVARVQVALQERYGYVQFFFEAFNSQRAPEAWEQVYLAETSNLFIISSLPNQLTQNFGGYSTSNLLNSWKAGHETDEKKQASVTVIDVFHRLHPRVDDLPIPIQSLPVYAHRDRISVNRFNWEL